MTIKNQPLATQDAEIASLFLTNISQITLTTGIFPSDLTPVFACGLMFRYINIDSTLIKKLVNPLKMTNNVKKFIKQSNNNVNNLNIAHGRDTSNYLPNNKMCDYFTQCNIPPKTVIARLRFGIFYKMMMESYYQSCYSCGKNQRFKFVFFLKMEYEFKSRLWCDNRGNRCQWFMFQTFYSSKHSYSNNWNALSRG